MVCLWMTGTGFFLAAAPRADACDVDDELGAAAAENPPDSEPAGLAQATASMSCELLVPGPHLRVTPRRPPTPADIVRAHDIRARVRQALGKYEDYRVAERDGFEIRFPNVQQKIYHFSNPANAAASYHEAFDPLRPTSILYEKTTTGYKLVGVMYTAPQRAREAGLDARFPISLAPWHLHTNICVPPPGARPSRHQPLQFYRQFGPSGSIATQDECTSAGGRFIPIKYGWMTHVDFYDSPKP
jgi:hypothetical protein